MGGAREAGRRASRALLIGAAAVVTELVVLLIPLYEGRGFFTSAILGFPLRFQVANAILVVAGAAVVVIGLVCLVRGRASLGAGVFLGAATLLTLRVISSTISSLDTWAWQAVVVLGLQAVEAALLFLAAAAALREGLASD